MRDLYRELKTWAIFYQFVVMLCSTFVYASLYVFKNTNNIIRLLILRIAWGYALYLYYIVVRYLLHRWLQLIITLALITITLLHLQVDNINLQIASG